MPRQRVPDDRAWLEKHLKPLMTAGDDIVAFDSQLPAQLPTYDRGYWTGLKLIALKYYLPAYLNILAPRKRVGYVDFFAGPGLNMIGERRVPVPGSPLLPLVIREAADNRMFSHVFLCETKRDYFEALRRRVKARLPEGCDATFFPGDANDFVNRLAEGVSDHDIGHCLVFVDPEGLEWHWDSMEKLVDEVECDVIINFPSAGLQRISTKQDEPTRRTIAQFLGIPRSGLPDVVDEEWAIGLYRSRLADMGKNISMEIMITDSGSFHYHLIPAVRQTRADSPWFFNVFEELKDHVDRLHGGILDLVAQQVEGKLGVL